MVLTLIHLFRKNYPNSTYHSTKTEINSYSSSISVKIFVWKSTGNVLIAQKFILLTYKNKKLQLKGGLIVKISYIQ